MAEPAPDRVRLSGPLASFADGFRVYEPVARVFLEERSDPIDADLARLSGVEVNAFVLRESRRRGRASALTMVCALRALLRFLHVRGLIAMSLATAVPSVPRRRE